ncbi:hypothetical protein FA95DRAFT_1555231 [Auriscalpium vulgare]|uniref:Uncharacterized protein n=1 Tax=Auriscalpium vulgare TaxID=40419 RepID=A0ACB8S3C2_9AGAM|nr:hypothetical protein FA95DRAFT_1555231 [Auriscalpium vulgare]
MADEDSAPTQPVQPTKLTAAMHTIALTALDKFCLKKWVNKTGSAFFWLPYTTFIPDDILVALLDNLPLIRDREALARLARGWEFLEEDGGALFDVICSLNMEFDAMRKESGEESTQTRRAAGLIRCEYWPHPASSPSQHGSSLEVEDMPGEDSAPTQPVQPTKLTAAMRTIALTALDKFCLQKWVNKTGSAFFWLPYTTFIPDDILVALLDSLPLIRDREALARLARGWEFLEEDGGALFDVICSLNTEFDAMRKEAGVEEAEEALGARATAWHGAIETTANARSVIGTCK